MADVAQIVERFGGPEALAERFKISKKAVEMWGRPERGIPGRWHLPLLRLAKEKRVKLTFDELSTQSQRAA